jgi:hypothetical protein
MIGDGFEDYVHAVTFSSVFICVFTLKQMQTLLIYDQWRSQPDSLVMLCKYFRVHRPWKQSISKEMNDDLKFA